MAELLQRADGGGESFQLVEAQVQGLELVQQAELDGEDRQTVVAQVQILQVLETTDGHGNFLQLQRKTPCGRRATIYMLGAR